MILKNNSSSWVRYPEYINYDLNKIFHCILNLFLYSLIISQSKFSPFLPFIWCIIVFIENFLTVPSFFVCSLHGYSLVFYNVIQLT